MEYELLKKLRDAGFPQTGNNFDSEFGFMCDGPDGDTAYIPLLGELIERCGKDFHSLRAPTEGGEYWNAFALNKAENWNRSDHGKTPEEAVAKLWLAIQEHGNSKAKENS